MTAEEYKTLAHPEAIVWEEFDDAIIAVAIDGRLVYSTQKMIEILNETDDMTEEDALDYLQYNLFNTYVNEYMPYHTMI
jgi:hypothetical protein